MGLDKKSPLLNVDKWFSCEKYEIERVLLSNAPLTIYIDSGTLIAAGDNLVV